MTIGGDMNGYHLNFKPYHFTYFCHTIRVTFFSRVVILFGSARTIARLNDIPR